MTKAYLYPISARFAKDHYNPYLDDFMNSLEGNFIFLNRNFPSGSGLLDILKYVGRIRYVFFHWPENISEKKFGLIQSLLLFLLIPVFKIKRIKIVYVVHNKISHTKNKYTLKKLISKTLIRNSFIIITHSQDGIKFINSLVKKKNNIFFFPHPVTDERPFQEHEKEIDVLIWGNIAPYKGVHRFISQMKNNEDCLRWKVVIAGKVSTVDYYKELLSDKPENVRIIDEFIDDLQLKALINKSKIVLFPYHSDTVLSSGAFAKSFVYPVEIIGPKCGSFNDFNHMEHVAVFENENEMIELIRSRLLSFNNGKTNFFFDEIIDKYSWQKFGEEFISEYFNINNSLNPDKVIDTTSPDTRLK